MMCSIQTWIGKGRANHIASFDLFFLSEFFFFYSYLFPAILLIFCSSSLLPCRLTKLPEALLLSVCHCWTSQDIAFLMPFLATETRLSVQIHSYFLIPPCCCTTLLVTRVPEWTSKRSYCSSSLGTMRANVAFLLKKITYCKCLKTFHLCFRLLRRKGWSFLCDHFQQISFYIEHGLNKCCTAVQAGMFKIVLSNFSMWHFNSVLIFFGKQKQISLGVEPLCVRRVWKTVFFYWRWTCGAKLFSSFLETWRR